MRSVAVQRVHVMGGQGRATRWRTAERLTRFPEKVVRCRSGADVETFVAALPHSRQPL